MFTNRRILIRQVWVLLGNIQSSNVLDILHPKMFHNRRISTRQGQAHYDVRSSNVSVFSPSILLLLTNHLISYLPGWVHLYGIRSTNVSAFRYRYYRMFTTRRILIHREWARLDDIRSIDILVYNPRMFTNRRLSYLPGQVRLVDI